jgi:hypothetical protein
MDTITRKKIADTKNNDNRQALVQAMKNCNADQVEPMLAVPTHREKQHITFDEYKAMLKSGMTPQQIIEQTSKHVVYFYNAMIEGRITLGKDEFVQLYDAGVSLDEIATKYHLSRNHVTYLREFYGIKRKGATFQKRLSSEVPLSAEAKSVIVVSILGDGHIQPLGYSSEKHCIAQADYLRWKASFVPDITTEKSFDEYEAYDKRYDKWHKGLSFRTRAHSWLYELGRMFYQSEGKARTKVVPENIFDMLDEMALAVWFMDDGSTDWGYRNGVKQYASQAPTCTIHTESFSFGDVNRLCDCLQAKFGLVCKPYPKDRKAKVYTLVIKFDSQSSSKMVAMLEHLSVPCMVYKLNEKSYQEKL